MKQIFNLKQEISIFCAFFCFAYIAPVCVSEKSSAICHNTTFTSTASTETKELTSSCEISLTKDLSLWRGTEAEADDNGERLFLVLNAATEVKQKNSIEAKCISFGADLESFH